jgi:hypothetical protein
VRTPFGETELLPDPARPRGWTLPVDGVPQSYVDLDDPERLEFGYPRLLGRLLRFVAAPARTEKGFASRRPGRSRRTACT